MMEYAEGLPGEQLAGPEIASVFPHRLATMRRSLELALAVLPQGTLSLKPTKRNRSAAVPVVITLYTKACKTFRTIQILCERGYSADAHTLTRSLFETSVLIRWILKERSPERAELYVAHLSLRNRKVLRCLKQTPGTKRFATIEAQRHVEENIAEHGELLSRFTAPQIKAFEDSYSGKSLEATCKDVGELRAYQVYYRYACQFAHASDLMAHVTIPQRGAAFILALSPEASPDLSQAMIVASSLLVLTGMAIGKKLGMPHDELKDFGARELGIGVRGFEPSLEMLKEMGVPPTQT